MALSEVGEKRYAHGAKMHQRSDREDRTHDYRAWRRQQESTPYTNDIDHVEWRVEDNRIIPVAVLELTRIDDNDCSGAYLQAILKRYYAQGQGRFIVHCADQLNCDAYIVAYYQDLTVFHLYNLSAQQGWKIMSHIQYSQWLRSLTPQAIHTKRRMRNG